MPFALLRSGAPLEAAMAENEDSSEAAKEVKMSHTRTASFPYHSHTDEDAEMIVEAAAPNVAGDSQALPGADVVAATAPFEARVEGDETAVVQSPKGKKGTGSQKPLSLLSSSLSRNPAVREGKNLADSTSGPKSRAIVDRYAAEVREADRNRKLGFLPMQQQIQYAPAGLDIARDLRAELNDLTEAAAASGAKGFAAKACQACGTPWLPDESFCRKCGKKQIGIGWDNLLGNDKFQKRMQYLHEHARTGHFTEQYGPDGLYEGDFLHGMRHGKGKYEFRDEVYEGEWKWDHRHGWGELRCNDGTIIKGEWQNGKPHGYASVVDQKGTVIYEGEFKDGKRHGLGRQVFESGDMYDGGWQNGRLHDRGVYYFTNGDRLYGMWREGIYDGVGVFHYADGSISRREYRDGLLMTVQDYEHATQRFGKTLTRDGMQKHTRDRDFPKEVFLLNAV